MAHRFRLYLCTSILLILSVSLTTLFPGQTHVSAQATNPPARLEVWSPDVRSSNITDPGLTTGTLMFPVGSMLKVVVNLTYSGQIGLFNIALKYNLTAGPNVLQAVRTGDELTGGLIDPNKPGGYGPNCSAAPIADEIDGGGATPGTIRVGAKLIGGCSVTGTGILFTLTFKVTGIGAGSIDIDDSISGASLVIADDANGNSIEISASAYPEYTSVSAYFRNKSGIPPIPVFDYSPAKPLLGDNVIFNATGSYDPDNKNSPGNGIQAEPVIYDSNGNSIFDAGDIMLLGSPPPIGTHLSRDPAILFLDANSNGKWDSGEP